MHALLSLGALGFSALAYGPLLWTYVFTPKRPLKSTWIVFTFVDVIVFLAMLSRGQLAIQILVYIAGAGSVMLIAVFWKGERGWNTVDKVVLAASSGAMLLWFFVSAEAAVILSVLAIWIGTYPLARELWDDPRSHSPVGWVLFWVGGIFGILAADKTPAGLIGPIGFSLQQTAIVLLGLPLRKAKPASLSPPSSR